MRLNVAPLLACFSLLGTACVTPAVPEPPATYSGVVRWQGVTKDELFNAMVRALHLHADYEVLPVGTAKDAGLIAVRKGVDDDTVHYLVRRANGRYSTYWAAKIRLIFLVEDAEGTASFSVRPHFKIMCRNETLSGYFYATCTPKPAQEAFVNQAITNRLHDDLESILIDVRGQIGPETTSDQMIYGQSEPVRPRARRPSAGDPPGSLSQRLR